MFAVGEKVKCVDAHGQPTLEQGGTYEVVRMTDRGIAVKSSVAELPYLFAYRRFARDETLEQMEAEYDTEVVREGGVFWRNLRYALLFSRDRTGAHAITYGFVSPDVENMSLSGGATIAGKKFRTFRTWARDPDPKKRGAMGLATFGPAQGSRISAAADGTIGDVVAVFWVTPEAKAAADEIQWGD